MNLESVRTMTIDIARQAGDVLMSFFEQPHQEATKSNVYDIVTEGDKASEKVIVKALQAAFPTHHIVGEEGGSMGAAAADADYFWYIDPLDGTSNFANNIPLFSVSIAMADRTMKPLVGVIYQPTTGEMFSAAAGGGAWLNDRRLRVSQRNNLEQSILVSGFPSDRDLMPSSLTAWGAFSSNTRGLRRLGSAAIDIAWVAAGRFDGYWERKINAWDCQAGIICVLEAGGKATDYAGNVSQDMYSGTKVVVSNGLIHDQMLAVLNGATST